MSETCDDLVELAKSGDLAAFDRLVSLHQERVFALACRILGSVEDASDIQQETFIRAWSSLRKFRHDASFSTWLHRITVNLCLSRKRRREYTLYQPEIDDRISDGVDQCPVSRASVPRA